MFRASVALGKPVAYVRQQLEAETAMDEGWARTAERVQAGKPAGDAFYQLLLGEVPSTLREHLRPEDMGWWTKYYNAEPEALQPHEVWVGEVWGGPGEVGLSIRGGGRGQ